MKLLFYKNRSEDEILLDQLFGDTITNEEDYFDANIFESENVDVAPSRFQEIQISTGTRRSTTPPPVFKQCTSLEECLGIDNANPDDEHYLRPLDYHDYMYDYDDAIGKKHALKKYDQFTLNTSCFLGSNTTIVQFHEIFVIKIMNKKFYYYC